MGQYSGFSKPIFRMVTHRVLRYILKHDDQGRDEVDWQHFAGKFFQMKLLNIESNHPLNSSMLSVMYTHCKGSGERQGRAPALTARASGKRTPRSETYHLTTVLASTTKSYSMT